MQIKFLSYLSVAAASGKHSRSKASKRQQLNFRPVHFAAVGLPLEDTGSNGGGSKTGAFKIDDGGVVGMSLYGFVLPQFTIHLIPSYTVFLYACLVLLLCNLKC